MENRVVHFSGIHGSGKSTLIRRLTEEHSDFFIEADNFDIPYREDILERDLLRFARSYIQVFMQQELAEKNPNKHVLCDRCVLDHKIYMNGFLKINWISKKHYDRIISVKKGFFSEEYLPKNVVFVNPPLDFVKERIQERWKKTGEVKWREKDFNYLKAVYDSYGEFFSKVSCNKLDLKETDLSKRIEKVMNWLKIPQKVEAYSL